MSEVHTCRKCGRPHSSKECEESRFCRNCGTFLIDEGRSRSTCTRARPTLMVSLGRGLYRSYNPQKEKDSAFEMAQAEDKMIREISLNVKEFRKIIREYYTKPRPDPFLDWFKKQEKAGVFQSLFEKVFVVIVDARFDQATKAEKALENTKRIFEAGLIRKEPAKLNEIPSLIPVAETTSEKWTESFFLAHRMLINYAEDIIKCPRWSAEKLVKKLQNIPYLGPKTSRLCVRWLHELIGDLEIDMPSYKVPIDRLLYRVACRLGIVNPYNEKYWVGYEGGPADEKIQDFARHAFPENPGLIDEPMWSEGRMPQDGGHCYPKNPIHSGCLFESVCPKKYEGVDPSRIGMVDSSRFRRFG